MNLKAWYLYNSGFAVDTGSHFLIFDYWVDSPKGAGLESGVISLDEIRSKDVIVFCSHRHGDHYNPKIISWQRELPKLKIILSDDIPPAPGAVMIGKNQRILLEGCAIETLASTDEGVAFIVEIDGKRIYHAGDLNWWHWEGEPEQENADMAYNYKKQINLMAGKTLDLAFAPVDPRLEAQYNWGIDYLMRTVDVKKVIPMHFGDNPSIIGKLLSDPQTAQYKARIAPLEKRGQSIELC
ncbi:MAG: MBL fold metallo-hydrolase [Clostridiales bacterium]|jgi:L-ascorbate metabolism protein UlaG (beta-lactamase superfamily)|nr:MBL fold metallo-hydrolase [Clostridiales bacterium]